MEKENYETYENLPASGSNSEAEPYQFFVVQDDGTFLINRQVQYVTQVQDKEELEPGQPCAIMDVVPQQFYVDVDTTAGMISVPEQFNGPEGSSNLYASSYLLQSASEAPMEEQIDDNVVDQLKANLQDDSPLPVASNSFTELLQDGNDPKPTPPESGKESEASPKPSELVEMETDGVPDTATKSNPETTQEHNVPQDTVEENQVSFETSNGGALNQTAEQEEDDLYANLFARRLRRYPESMRYMLMHKIDEVLFNNACPGEPPASSPSTSSHTCSTFCPPPQYPPTPSPERTPPSTPKHAPK